MNKRHQIVESINGHGDTQWSVITLNAETGQWLYKEDFTSKAEAESWLKYAC